MSDTPDPITHPERWSAIASCAIHLLCALPIVLIASGHVGRDFAKAAQDAGIMLPWITQFFVELGDRAIAAIALTIAAVGFASAWIGWRTSRVVLPTLLLGAQCWWTAMALIAYLLPLIKILEVMASPE
ncbi:MAG TPA: hypothetical protein VEL07_18560 [Planctomycetota bacterium]|nr:hypothetical protein [Planctomycetota bacterium]